MRIVIAGVLALLLAACTIFGVQSEKAYCCLTIARFPSQVLLGRYPLPGNRTFSLSFIHSVSQTPVRDHYQVIDARIIQVAETFQAHGAGLPYGIVETGVTGWEQHDGRFVVRMQRPIDRLVVRTDRNYRNRLQIDDFEINLNDWVDQALEISIVPCTTP